MKKLYILLPVLVSIFLIGCQSIDKQGLYSPSNFKVSDTFSSFKSYQEETFRQLKENRYFLTDNEIVEVEANSPFEMRPKPGTNKNTGVLLIHGLGDSPWTFKDIGEKLAGEGYLVRTVLLSGHGSRPADLISADYRQWRKLVSEQVRILKQDVDNVYLGGFSTGANLAYLEAKEDADIKGLILFSPAFKSTSSLDRFAPYLSMVKDWIFKADPGDQKNYVRYDAMPTNAFAQYYYTSRDVLKTVNESDFDRPVFMVLSEHDGVVDSEAVLQTFEDKLINPDSQLIWYGDQSRSSDTRVSFVDSEFPKMRVSNMSHMGLMFSPSNSYYGVNGENRMCQNGLDANEMEHCRAGKPVWYSAWGFKEEGKVHARLTFNPEFNDMSEKMTQFLDAVN